MAFRKIGQTRVSHAFWLARQVGRTVDGNVSNGGMIDIASQDIIRLMDRNFPDVSRQITFNTSGRTLPSGFTEPDTVDVDSDGRVTMDFDYDSDTYANTIAFGIDYHLQSQPLKKGKKYFEIHVNSVTQRSGSVGQEISIAPTNWNLVPAFEPSVGRGAFFDFNDRDMAGIINTGTYQWTSGSADSDTKAGDIIMVAYDTTNANDSDAGRVFFGFNGEWGHPTDSSTMVDLNPANYDSSNAPIGNGGVGIPILIQNTNVGATRQAQLAGVTGQAGDLTGDFFSLGFYPQGLNDGAGDSSGSIDVTIKCGSNVTYTPPPGFKAH